jgi:phage head maturation protease
VQKGYGACVKQRIRLEVADRGEEVNADVDFPGRDQLRQRILAAHTSGDGALLCGLQAQHHDMRLAYSAPSVRAVPLRYRTPVAPTASSVLRTATSAEVRGSGDVTRQIRGYLLTWGARPTAVGEDGEDAVMLDIQPAAISRWLGSINPQGMGLVADHQTASVGAWRSFVTDALGLLSIAEADYVPGGDALLDACDSGAAQGLSFKAHITRSHATGQQVHGLPLVVADEIELQEAGPTPSPSDAGAEILLVRGRTPRWRQQAEDDTVDRAAWAAQNLPAPTRRAPAAQAWRPHFAR